MGVTRKQSTPNVPKNEHFLPSVTHTCVCVSGDEKCSFSEKFHMFCFLTTPVLRFALLLYDQRITTPLQQYLWALLYSNIFIVDFEQVTSKKYPANIYLFKVKQWNSRKRCEICLKLTIKTPEQRHWRRSGVFTVNFEHISHLFLLFLSLTLKKKNCSWDYLTKNCNSLPISPAIEF